MEKKTESLWKFIQINNFNLKKSIIVFLEIVDIKLIS